MPSRGVCCLLSFTPEEHRIASIPAGFRHIVYRFSLLIPTWWEDSCWPGWNVTLLSSKVDADAVALACAAQACRDGRRRVGCRISFEFGGWLWRNDEGVLFGWPVRALAPGIWWKGPLRYNKVPSGTQKWYHTIYHSCYNLICGSFNGMYRYHCITICPIQSYPKLINPSTQEQWCSQRDCERDVGGLGCGGSGTMENPLQS